VGVEVKLQANSLPRNWMKVHDRVYVFYPRINKSRYLLNWILGETQRGLGCVSDRPKLYLSGVKTPGPAC
jgi:hypothetical protein